MISPLEHYRRWRHSRGFGVHSPWAYGLITQALNERAFYYSYPSIDVLFGERAKTAKTVLRILIYLNIRSVEVCGASSWELLARTAVGPKGLHACIVDDPSDLARAREAEAVVFTCLGSREGREAWEKLLAEREGGIAVDTHREIGVLCRQKGLPRQDIHLKTLWP